MIFTFLILCFIVGFIYGRKLYEPTCQDSSSSSPSSSPSSCFESLENPMAVLKSLKHVTDTAMKDSLFTVMKETVEHLDIPVAVKDKIRNDQFLKEKIDFIMSKKEDEKESVHVGKKSMVDVDENKRDDKKTTINGTKWSPYGGEVRLHDWNDFYRHFPQYANKVHLWKLEFKEVAIKNAKKFGGCANPAKLVDWLVPDIEEVKKDQERKKYKY